MHPDLERIVSEDEAAGAGVEAAGERARVQLEAVRADLFSQREERLRELQQEVDRAAAQILAEGNREVELRQAQRETRRREDAARSATLIARAADLWAHIIREGVTSRGSP